MNNVTKSTNIWDTIFVTYIAEYITNILGINIEVVQHGVTVNKNAIEVLRMITHLTI